MKILVALLIPALCALASTAASAQGAYCLRGCDFGSGDCSYASYQQCQATVSGRVGWCDVNPEYRPVRELQPQVHPKFSRRRL